MIRIRTSEWLGMLGDIKPFVCPDDDYPDWRSIHVAWDGETLHLQATDGLRFAWLRWHPASPPIEDHPDSPLVGRLGGADDPWECFIPADEAMAMIPALKLSPKRAFITPLEIDYLGDRGQLQVTRTPDTGHSQVRIRVNTTTVDFPNITKIVSEATRTTKVATVAYAKRRLDGLEQVRAHGLVRFSFGGEAAPTLVEIGDRFSLVFSPERTG